MSATAATHSLTSLVDRLLDSAAAEAGERPPERTIEITRREGSGPDVAVRLGTARWADAGAGRRALDALGGDARVADVRVRGSRITMRFSDEHIAALGAALEAGAAGLGSTLLAGQSWGVEFCDPNANKALHIGHLRNVALGNALAAVLARAGAAVATQSIVCDIGRNVCEAMAGYFTAPPATDPAAAGLKADHFIGRCYSRYVGSTTRPPDGAAAADAPIERELRATGDLADRLMSSWTAGDVEVRQVWRRLRAWALDGQAETLARLGIHFDRLLFESDAFSSLGALIGRGLDSGAFVYGDDGALVFQTGLPEYPVLPLVRPDGFPTEHLRVIGLWYAPASPPARVDACVHVLGEEWLASTACRELLAAQLGERPMFASYVRVAHGMVVVDGDLMKSSTGRALLVDDCLDRLARIERTRRLGEVLGGPEAVARLVALGFFLDGRPFGAPISFSWPALEADDVAAWSWARAWEAAVRGSHAAGPDPDGADPSYRFAVLQAQVLPGLLERAAETLDPAPLARYLTHLVRWHATARTAPRVQRVVRTTLEAALGALGLTTEEMRCPQTTTCP